MEIRDKKTEMEIKSTWEKAYSRHTRKGTSGVEKPAFRTQNRHWG